MENQNSLNLLQNLKKLGFKKREKGILWVVYSALVFAVVYPEAFAYCT
jgi:hypothetical protein